MKLASEHVITWGAQKSRNINITPDQEKTLTNAGMWPKDYGGNEYASVVHGLHSGRPTFTDQQISRIAAGEHCMDILDEDDMSALPTRANDGD